MSYRIPNLSENPPLISPSQAAKEFKVSVSTIRRALTAYKTPTTFSYPKELYANLLVAYADDVRRRRARRRGQSGFSE